MMEAGFYISSLFTICSDNRRKDFWVMTGHHLITLALLWISYAQNYMRIGAIIMCLHDSADVFLEARTN